MHPFPPGFAVIDVETTGLRPQSERIIEIGLVRTDVYGNVLSELSTLLNPQRNPGATHIHGITPADITDAPRFREVLPELVRHLAGAVLVGHNLRFDRGFLQHEFSRTEYAFPAAPQLCTRDLAVEFLPHLPNYRLPTCGAAIGIHHAYHHTALEDARVTTKLLQHFGRMMTARTAWPWGFEIEQARAVAWPHIVGPSRLLTRRGSAERRAAEKTYLSRLVGHVPARSAEGNTNTRAYFSMLDEILEDRRVTAEEAQAIYEVAHSHGLGGEDLLAAHRTYLVGLVRVALADGVITDVEAADLANVTSLLGLSESDLHRAFMDARAGVIAPMPGEERPLRVGMTVCFTGESVPPKDELEHRARQTGLRVVSAMSGKVDVLVVDDPYSMSVKAQQARDANLRVLAVPTFLSLLARCEPAEPGSKASVHSPAERRRPQSLGDLDGKRVLVLGVEADADVRLTKLMTAAGATIAKRLTPSVDIVVHVDEESEAERIGRARDLGCVLLSVREVEALPETRAEAPSTQSPVFPAQSQNPPPAPVAPIAQVRSASSQREGAPWPSGWYPDPWGAAPTRWWDGSRWTEHVQGRG
ncbi:exonuclease domain-containing protein [Polyangium sorediatum]|uniref:Exonuclease domain-containing protein n=1 Tax=Polyangium sorediatum TaxID=889274 RepID=A0ABT6P4E2_9BACT|nr:exonuclease domain-containing protein [Polyangium sorediatum]MDI1435391.1 exonuclease domain-containing protein [Polyangium sorediatum]